MRFTIKGGDSYCVAFGSAAGGKVINAPAKGTPNKLFKIVGPTSEGCPRHSVMAPTASDRACWSRRKARRNSAPRSEPGSATRS